MLRAARASGLKIVRYTVTDEGRFERLFYVRYNEANNRSYTNDLTGLPRPQLAANILAMKGKEDQ